MRIAVTKFSIEHLVETGCTDLIVDGIKRLEAQRDELIAASQWRPIETAPKDGTWVLLWWKETPTGSECFDEWSPGQAVGKWHYDCWMRCSEYSVGGAPTAWQPLPNPPSPTL